MAERRAKGRFRRTRKRRLGLWTGVAAAVLIVAYLGVLELSRPHVDGDRIRYDVLDALIADRRVVDATVLDQDAYLVGRYRDASGATARFNLPLVAGGQRDILEILARARVPTEVDQQVGKRVAQLGSVLLPGMLLVVLFGYMVLSYKRGSGIFAIRSGARRIEPEHAPVRFTDVAGQDAAVGELLEIKEFLGDPERFSRLGAQVPRGVLLYGPPGCGKTMLARALAGEAGAAFFALSGSDFVELYVGVGAARVRDAFREAREAAPAIVFIDELDSIGSARHGGGSAAAAASSNAEHDQALNQLLAELDGLSTNEGVILLAATNRPDVLDQALLRPGRFDRAIGLERPDEAARLAILEVHARGKPLDPGADLAKVAGRAIGLTGADLAGVVNEGALLAARAGRAAIEQEHLDDALQRVLETPERQRRLSLRSRRVGRRFSSSDRVTFEDVAGVEDAVVELAEIRDYLADPERYAAMGARVPRGVLLSGPPGCGKTLLARAVAGEANAAFLTVAASEFVEVFAGEGAGRVRDLFSEAKAIAPAIVFIDEVDAIGARRGAAADGHREREQTLNQILVELDGFDERAAVIVMAATNRADILDAALVRPGRFDRHVQVRPPTRAGREAILALHARDKRLAGDVDLATVAHLTAGFAGADLANVMNEAALLAARRGAVAVTMAIVEEAVERAALGVASSRPVLSDAERRIVAYHEVGHALVALRLAPPGPAPVHKLSIVPRAAAVGNCSMLEGTEATVRSRARLSDEIAVLLGGRAAEQLVFGDPMSSASDDLRRATELAQAMVRELGMSETLGAVVYAAPSEADAALITQEVRRIIDDASRRAAGILSSARPALDAGAEALLRDETLSAAELTRLAAPYRT